MTLRMDGSYLRPRGEGLPKPNKPMNYVDSSKRVAEAATGAFENLPKRVKSDEMMELPKLPASFRFTFIGTKNGSSSQEVKKEFAAAWDAAKTFPDRGQSKRDLFQPEEFTTRCEAFFAKGDPNPFNVSVETATNPAMGKGAFIQREVRKGTIIGYYPLCVVKESDFQGDQSYLINLDRIPELSGFLMDGRCRTDENFTPYINDIGEPNVEMRPYNTEKGPVIVILTREDFKEGEKKELSLKYGESYWNLIKKPKISAMEVEEKEFLVEDQPRAKAAIRARGIVNQLATKTLHPPLAAKMLHPPGQFS